MHANSRCLVRVIFSLGVYVSLYERPGCQVPRHPLSIFLSSCVPSFLLFDRAAGFLPPRPRIVAGRRA